MGKNADTVMGMYAAFGRGDVEHILGQLHDDIVWDEGIRDTGLPYLVPGRGKDHAAGFFGALSATIEFTVFEPGVPCEGGDTVIVPIREVAKNLTTGATIPDDVYVHIWTFDADGKATSFRHVGDLAAHESAAGAAVRA